MFVIHEAYQGSRTQLAQNNARFGWLYNLAPVSYTHLAAKTSSS